MDVTRLSDLAQLDVLGRIARQAEETYWQLRRSIPVFCRATSDPDVHLEYLREFGYTSSVVDDKVYHHRRGVLHRLDGPAIVGPGYEVWFVNGCMHRDNGPATTHEDGSVAWYKNGMLHREDGPAVIHASGRKEWRIRGILHRGGGLPAVTDAAGNGAWFVDGRFIC